MNLILIFLSYLASGFGLGRILNKIEIARRTDSGVVYSRNHGYNRYNRFWIKNWLKQINYYKQVRVFWLLKFKVAEVGVRWTVQDKSKICRPRTNSPQIFGTRTKRGRMALENSRTRTCPVRQSGTSFFNTEPWIKWFLRNPILIDRKTIW